MYVLLCSINTLKGLYDISGVEVGQHLYWQIGGFQVHAQVLITSWVVIVVLLGSVLLAVHNQQTIPTNGKNFLKYVIEFIRDVRKIQIGEEYGQCVSFIGTMFLFIFVSKCSGALLPLKIIQLSHGELATPIILDLLTSLAYFYAGLPINILEDFTKPLSLSFLLFKNIFDFFSTFRKSYTGYDPYIIYKWYSSSYFATLAMTYIGKSMEGHH